MGEIQRRSGDLVRGGVPAGDDPTEYEWVPSLGQVWRRVSDIPKQMREQFFSQGLFPTELLLYGATHIEVHEKGRHAGREFGDVWIAGDDCFSLITLLRNGSSWSVESTKRIPLSATASLKRKSIPKDPSDSDGAAEIDAMAEFTGKFSVLPALVRQQIYRIRPFVMDPVEYLTHHGNEFPTQSRQEIGFEYAGMFIGQTQVLAIEASQLTEVPAGLSKEQAYARLDATHWNVQVVLGAPQV